MDPKVERLAKELAQALRNAPEYERLQAARRELEKHEAARIMWNDFQKRQQELQNRMMAGENVTEADLAPIQRLYELIGLNPYIRELLEAEYQFAETLMAVQRILSEAIAQDGAGAPEAGGAAPSEGPGPSGRIVTPQSKLWTPGTPLR